MSLKHALTGIALAVGMTGLYAPTTLALGLKIAPLEYTTTLKKNERLKGIIDVSNPSGQTVHIRTSVQAFRQLDNDGSLQFYDDSRIAAGIKTDVSQFDLGPREALRMSFNIDGAVLPQGDVYAAIFFTTDPVVPRNGVGELVRVGTIVSIVNQTPGPRSAVVTATDIPFLQFSDTLSGSYRVKNTGPSDTGFYPTVKVSAWPSSKTRDIDSSLVFGGRERANDFQFAAGYGVHYVTVRYDGSEKGQWVVALAPWMVIMIMALLLIVGIEVLLYKRRHNSWHRKTPPTS